jgi:hypothetical protein
MSNILNTIRYNKSCVAWNQENVVSWLTCLPADCCSSELDPRIMWPSWSTCLLVDCCSSELAPRIMWPRSNNRNLCCCFVFCVERLSMVNIFFLNISFTQQIEDYKGPGIRRQNSQLIQHISIKMVNLHSDIFNLNGILHTFDLSYFNQQVYQVKE